MSGARLVLPRWVEELDATVDRAWEPLRDVTVLNRLFYAASAAGDFSAVWHGLNIARVVVGPQDRSRFVRLATALALESLLVNQGLKRGFERQRPEHLDARPHRLRAPSTSSFPSGHASSATMAALLLSERSRYGALYAAVAAVVATSRIHVRIHHASDVIAGAAVGAACAAVWKRVWPLQP